MGKNKISLRTFNREVKKVFAVAGFDIGIVHQNSNTQFASLLAKFEHPFAGYIEVLEYADEV